MNLLSKCAVPGQRQNAWCVTASGPFVAITLLEFSGRLTFVCVLLNLTRLDHPPVSLVAWFLPPNMAVKQGLRCAAE